jgi:hypothetical protein
MRLTLWILAALCAAAVWAAWVTHVGARSGSDSTSIPDRRWSVWTAPQMRRIGKTDRPAESKAVELWAAGGEYESFQIIVSAGTETVDDVDVKVPDLAGPGQSRIRSSAFEFYREHYVNITRSSPDPGSGNRPLGKGWYPDALIPRLDPETRLPTKGRLMSFPFHTAPNENQPIWVDIHVPSGTHPGLYATNILVISNQGEISIPVTLHVWGFSLPSTPTLKSSFGMHQPALFDPRVHRILLEHGIMPVNINPRDAHEFQKTMGLNITGLRFWGASDRKACHMDAAPPPTSFLSELANYPADLPVYVYPADEIDPCPNLFQTVREWAANMHSADPRVKDLITIAPVSDLSDDGTGTGRSAVDIWVLLPKLYESHLQQIRNVRAKGDEVWSYTALVQDSYSPKWEIDFAPINYRIMPGFLSQSLGLTGILYWRIELWTQSPWQDVYGFNNEKNTYPGEGMLVYPGAEVGVESVVPSMRLNWIRKGIEDYEYVAILNRMGRGQWANARISRAAKDWHNWTEDITVIESVRRELGEEITRLSASQNAH